MRVVAGTARGRRLATIDDPGIRPTTDRVREAVFNSLFSHGGVEGWRVVDAFAGSGALGIEALSRGAAHVTFVDRSRAALEVVRTNLSTLGLAERAAVVAGDAVRVLREAGPVDLVLLDPPYDYDDWPALIEAAAAARWLVLESDRELDVPDPDRVRRVRRYGSTVVTLLGPPDDGADGDADPA